MATEVTTGGGPAAAQRAGGPRRGLVLGGGGMLGAAWTVGALCAVEEATGWRPGSANASSPARWDCRAATRCSYSTTPT